MPKTPAGQPKIKVNHGRLQIVLSYRGVRNYLSLGLPDSKQNRVYADMVLSRIRSDLLNDNFDPSLGKYKREAQKPDEPKLSDDISIAQLWERYTTFKRPQLAPSTIAKDFKRVSNHIAKFPVSKIDGAVAVRDYLNSTTTPSATKKVLTQLSACCDWAVDSKLIALNPFEGMAAGIKVPKAKTDDEDIFVFTPDERDRIIQKIGLLNSSYGSLVEFLFRTGCRPSESAGLVWRHISPDFKTITFEQAVTVGENGLTVKQELKTQQKRVFPCNKNLTAFLKSIAPGQIDREQFIFRSPKGKYVDFHNFSNREWKSTLEALGIEHRGVYQTRHTFITFCINSGMNAKDVARLVGNSPEIIYKHYMGGSRDLVAPDI